MRSCPELSTRRHFLDRGSAPIDRALSIAQPIHQPRQRPAADHARRAIRRCRIDSGVVWARTDRPARMQIEIATTESFRDVRQGVFVDALPQTDFTAKALLEDLPPGQDIFYRVRFQDHSSPTILSEPAVGRFRTAPARAAHGVLRLGRRRLRSGLGHRRSARRHAHLRDDAAGTGRTFSFIPATRSTPTIRCRPR